MPWLETHVVDQRLQCVREARDARNRRAVFRRFGISPTTGYKWLARVADEGQTRGVRDRSRRPHTSPGRTPLPVVDAVIALRIAYGWGGRKLQRLLAQTAGYTLAASTIDAIIAREGLVDPDAVHHPAPGRFEHPRPNALWQMDFKGGYPLSGGLHLPLSILDDHSRYALAVAPLRSTARGPVQRVLRHCFDQYGLPDAILVDHGVPWYHPTNGLELTRLTVFLLEQDIAVRYSGIAHPQTQGKVERFHRTLGRRLRQWGIPTTARALAQALERFRVEYNDVRPHAALQLHTPASRYVPSPRAFTARPQPWTYAADHAVVRVNDHGRIQLNGRTYHLSKVLARRWVGCRLEGPHALIAFRGYYVRELNLRTGALTRTRLAA